MSITSETDTHRKSKEYNVLRGLREVIHHQVQVLTFNCQRKAHYQIKEIDPLAPPKSNTLGYIVEMTKHIHKMKNKTTSQSFYEWRDRHDKIQKCCYLKL